MEENKNIQHKIEVAFHSLDAIQETKVSPFFKEKIMQRLFAEKEEKQSVFSWFTPQFQLATLVIVLVLNVIAITQIQSDAYNDNVSEFAEIYGLSEPSTESLFH